MAAPFTVKTMFYAVMGLTTANGLISIQRLFDFRAENSKTQQLLERNYEEAEARMDELEGTLRGHIGLMEESLERIEDKLNGVVKEGGEKGGWGKGMGKRAQELYEGRGRDGFWKGKE